MNVIRADCICCDRAFPDPVHNKWAGRAGGTDPFCQVDHGHVAGVPRRFLLE